MIAWAIETFVATTLLMLLVLVIRTPVRKAFGPNIAYALWLLPVLRLALPPLPESWREQAAAPIAAASEAITIYVVEPIGGAPAAAPEASFGWLMAVLLAWAAGAALFLGYHLVSHGLFCRRLLKRARIDRMVAEGRVRVIETDAAHGPLAFGIWRKYVAFPRDFSERYDEVERDLALAHELGHHVRGDLIANWVALLVLALHWFNPVAWKAFRAFRADQEMACDALVLAGRAQALRHAYGRAIVKSAHGGAVSAACHLHTINELKGRLRMLSKTRKFSPIRMAGGAIGVSALSLAALGLTASGTQAAERIKDRVEAATGIDLSGQSVPTPPEAPDAPEAQAVPEAPEAPEAPPAPDAPRVEKHKKVIVMRHGDGPPHVVDIPDLPDMAEIEKSIPEIRSANCGAGEGDGKRMVWTSPKKDGEKQKIVICVNRIEAHAAMAKDRAMRSAMMGLRHARATIENSRDMTPEQRAEALEGIDQAIAEIDKESAGNDD